MMDGVLNRRYANERKKKRFLIFRYKERALIAAEAIRKYISSKSDADFVVLDFGAADGLALLEIAKILNGKGNYLGVEYDQGLVESTSELPSNVKLVRGDITNLGGTIREGSADVITCLAVLEHLANPLMAIKEAKRILKPGGIFIATSPVPFWHNFSEKFGAGKKNGQESHVTDINKEVLFKLADRTGLRVEKYFKFMWLPISFLPYLNIPVNVSMARDIDNFIRKFEIFNWSFVNQCLVLKK